MLGFFAAFLAAVNVTVDLGSVKAEVPRTIYGTGLEDVNHEIYGGLDAQRLYGESFEEPALPPGPRPIDVRRETSGCWEAKVWPSGELIHDRSVAHWGRASQLLVPNGTGAAVLNSGLGNAGISVVRGRRMRGVIYARGETDSLVVRLVTSSNDTAYAEAKLDAAPGDEWKRLEFTLEPNATDAKARFMITAYGYGRIWVDDAYLADEPANEFGRIGCREDIVAGLRKMGVTFLRWGGTMCNAEDYLLKNFDGTRRPYRGFWHRYSSGGFGPREFVRLAAALKLPCALSISAREDVADAVRFAEELKTFDIPITVEIGNEECIFTDNPETYRRYCRLVKRLVPPMRAANPRLSFAHAAWWTGDNALMEETFRALDGVVEFWDLHPAPGSIEGALGARSMVREFLAAIRRWNASTTMRAAVFEENGSRHDLCRALGHALMLEEIRAAGRDVLTSCPANALQAWRQNDNGWDQGNVFYTPDKVWLQPCAWAQQMAAANHRELLVASAVDAKDVSVSATKDRVGASVVLHIVNISDKPRALSVAFKAGEELKLEKATVLSAAALDAENTPDAPDRVSPKDATADFRMNARLPPTSYTVLEYRR